MKTIFVTFLLLVAAASSFAQAPDTLWTRTYGGSSGENALSVQQTADGGYIVAGWTLSYGAGSYDYYLVKTNGLGDTLWTRTYGGGSEEQARSVQQTADGGYIVAGWTYSFGAGPVDFYLVKTNSLGDTLWTRTYGGNGQDWAESVQQTTDGGYIVAGGTDSFGASADLYLVKVSSLGDTLWTRTYGGSSWDEARSVQQTDDGGYIVAGYSFSFGAGYNDFYIVKTNSQGDTLWTRTYGGNSDDYVHSVQQTADGGYIVAGYTTSFGEGDWDFYLVKTNPLGDTLWTRTYGGSHNDFAHSVQQTADGGYAVAGFTLSFGAGGYDFYLVKTNNDGDTLWAHTYGGTNDEYAVSVEQTTDGSYIVAGETESFGAGDFDFYLVKTEADQILPVELFSFDAISSSSGIRLSFSTASETNNDFFEIMRGASATGTFARIATLPSQGNSSTAHQYEYLDRDVTAGQTFWYYLADVDLNGNRTEHRELMRSATMTGSIELPSDYALSAYPNPFNPSATISFALPEEGVVRIAVFDVAGRWIQTLVNEERSAGNHTVSFDARDLPSGVYFARMESGRFAVTEKVLLIR